MSFRLQPRVAGAVVLAGLAASAALGAASSAWGASVTTTTRAATTTQVGTIAPAVTTTQVGTTAPASTTAAEKPVPGRIVLSPGSAQIRIGAAVTTVPAAELLDFNDLVDLVAATHGGSQLVQRTATTVFVRVPIDQQPGSRLAISSDTVPAIQFTGRGRLSGTGAILSINGVDLLGRGSTPGRTGDLNPLVGYDRGSGVRMSRVQLDDQRTGKGAGPAVDISGGEFRIVSSQVYGGLGAGIHLDDVAAAEVTGVQVENARGAGLIAGGSTNLTLTDVTLSGSTGPGLTLRGHALSLVVGGVVRLAGNGGGTAGQLDRRGTASGLDVSAIQIIAKAAAPKGVSAAKPSVAPQSGRLPLSWLGVTAGLLLAGAAGIEIARNR